MNEQNPTEVSVIVYVWLRWLVLTIRRYDLVSLVTGCRCRHAGVGRAVVCPQHTSSHRSGTDVHYLIRLLRQERALLPLAIAA